jgi:hypothetical protein
MDINTKNIYPVDKANSFALSFSSMLLNLDVIQFEIGSINTIMGRLKAVHSRTNAKMDL